MGVGGLATAGGIGFLGRKHGLTIDHVTAAEIVLADGRVVRADGEQHPDLLWALRGAGGNSGIVTALELDACPVGDFVFSRMVFEADAGMLERWAQRVEAAPRELTSFLTMVADRDGTDIAQLYTVYAGEVEPAVEALPPAARGRPSARPAGQSHPLSRGRRAAGRPAHRLEPPTRRALGAGRPCHAGARHRAGRAAAVRAVRPAARSEARSARRLSG